MGGILGASFFFSHDVEELSDPSLVFPTLAFQLAQFDSQYKHALYDILKEDILIASANLETQFEGLFHRPLSACHGDRHILIMLDALDECSREEDVKTMLQILLHSNVLLSGGLKLRFLITSRPEPHIHFVFAKRDGEEQHEKFILHDIDANLARDDIRTFLKAEFAKFPSLDLPELPPIWPPPEQFDLLLNRCGLFFAYAATAVRFIGDEGVRDPRGQLGEILVMSRIQLPVGVDRPYLDLDTLYLNVLQRAVSKNPREEHAKCIQRLLATILCLRKPLKIDELVIFLFMTKDEVLRALRFLHSVVVVPDDVKEPVRFFHQSFPDFLRDKPRCTDGKFFVNDHAHEDFMASRCMDENGRTYLQSKLYEVKVYSFEYWASHFRSGSGRDCRDEFEKSSIWATGDGVEEAAVLEWMKAQRTEEGFCFDETQEIVVKSIQNWFTGEDDGGRHVFWLYGEADQQIATTIVTRAREKAFLGGSFFYGFRAVEFYNHCSVFPVLASQLAQLDSQYRRALYDVLKEDNDALSASLQSQFESLICRPLSACQSGRAPILIVLDDFDNFYFHRANEVLRILSQFGSEFRGPKLRILITSSPRVRRHLMPAPRAPFEVYDFDEYISRNDIEGYLKAEFAKFFSADSDFPTLPKDWPPPEELNKLVEQCGSLFAYAETAVQFIGDEHVQDPVNQLRELLDMTANQPLHVTDRTSPYANLDTLYRAILLRAAEKYPNKEHMERAQRVIATVACLREVLALRELAAFLSISAEDIRDALRDLHSVFNASDPSGEYSSFFPVRPSFHDFIQDKDRCTDEQFFVNVPAHEHFMMVRCFNVMRNDNSAQDYAYKHLPSHMRSAALHGLSNELMQELIWLIGDKDALIKSYYFARKEDIIPFVRSLVVSIPWLVKSERAKLILTSEETPAQRV